MTHNKGACVATVFFSSKDQWAVQNTEPSSQKEMFAQCGQAEKEGGGSGAMFCPKGPMRSNDHVFFFFLIPDDEGRDLAQLLEQLGTLAAHFY